MTWLRKQWDIMGQEVGFSWRWCVLGMGVVLIIILIANILIH